MTTPRERVLNAIAHRESDRVPVDMGAMRSTGIMAMAHARLKKALGLAGPVKVYDLVQQLAQPEDEILDRFGIDAVDLGRGFLTREEDWHEWVLPDGTPCLVPYYFKPENRDGTWEASDEEGDRIAKMPPGIAYFSQTLVPLRDIPARDFEKHLPAALGKVVWGGLVSPPYHLALDKEGLARMREGARQLAASTDRAIMVAFGGNLLEWSHWLLGMEECFMSLAERDGRVETLVRILTDLHLENLTKVLDAVGEYVQLIQMGDDLGTQSGPQISPETYRRVFKPGHSQIFHAVREQSQVHVFFHCCGGIRPLIPDLIDAGVEILNPVQTSAAGMDPAELKKQFGNHLCFWGGGCDTQKVLPRGTPEEVRRCVRERLAIFSPGGGYVWNQVHNITAEVPVENILAMYDEVDRCR